MNRCASRLGRVRLGIISLCCLLAACGGVAPTPGTTAACPASDAERIYGCSPRANDGITYQPNVVFVDASAIRSWSRDGRSWTLDGAARGVRDLAAGKILLATGMAAGRVVSVRTVGSDVEVTTGPVAMGEVIRDGTLDSNGKQPLDAANALVAPDLPGTEVDAGLSDEPSGAVSANPIGSVSADLAAYRPVRYDGQAPRAADDVQLDVDLSGNGFTVTCCTSTLGTRINYDAGGLRLRGGIWLKLDSPTIEYHLDFANGILTEGHLALEGLKGLHVEFDAATSSVPDAEVAKLFLLPVQVTMRIAPEVKVQGKEQAPPPITVGIFELVYLATQFQAKSGSLKATGDYDFEGPGILVSVANDALDADAMIFPTGFTPKTKLGDTMTGFSVGRAEVGITLATRVCVCFGSLITSDGLFFQLTSGIDVVNVSNAVAFLGGRCQAIAYSEAVRPGYGHFLTKPVVDRINADLAPSGPPTLDAEGGHIGDSIILWAPSESIPKGYHRCQLSQPGG